MTNKTLKKVNKYIKIILNEIDMVKRLIISLYEEDFDSYKLYLSDTGLFITLMFIDRPSTENDVYAKLLSDKLPANLGYLYENLVAQMITASGRELYYHTWEKEKRNIAVS